MKTLHQCLLVFGCLLLLSACDKKPRVAPSPSSQSAAPQLVLAQLAVVTPRPTVNYYSTSVQPLPILYPPVITPVVVDPPQVFLPPEPTPIVMSPPLVYPSPDRSPIDVSQPVVTQPQVDQPGF